VNQTPIPTGVHIASDGEPICALGAYVGNGVDNIAVWTPTIEKVDAALQQWGKSHPTHEGQQLIVNMFVGGLTQYLTRVQGIPSGVEDLLSKRIQKFMWGESSTPMVNIARVHHGYG
jgi:hypothetical protein